MAFNIRLAEKNDVSAILGLIQELAVFEKEPEAVIVTEADLLKHGFGAHPLFTCFVAEKNEERICWEVLDWNEPAIKFYESKGATLLKDWYLVQMNEESIKHYIDNIN